jgi:hypothetical protein
MRASNTRTSAGSAKPDAQRAPLRRFRIEKLEERIAPKKGGKGTHNCGGGSSQTTGLCGSTSVF